MADGGFKAFDFAAFAAAVQSNPPYERSCEGGNANLSVASKQTVPPPPPPPGFETITAPRCSSPWSQCCPPVKERPLLAADGSAGYGGGEFAEDVLIRETAPDEKKFKWNYLWGQLPSHLMGQIEMDEVASFSVTDMRTADKISQELLNLADISENSVITDCTACVGGNAISFARFFRTVHAIELDEARIGMLKNNINVCKEGHRHQMLELEASQASMKNNIEEEPGKNDDSEDGERIVLNGISDSFFDSPQLRSRYEQPSKEVCKSPEKKVKVELMRPIIGEIKIHLGDCLQICPTLRQDLLFLDPPWGGKSYSKRDTVELFLSKKALGEVCAELGKHCRYVAVKLPHNANMESLMGFGPCRHLKDVVLNKKMKLTVLEYNCTISQDQLNFLLGLGLKVSGHQ